MTSRRAAHHHHKMARAINIGDEVAITATVRGRVTEDRVSVSIPSYGSPPAPKRQGKPVKVSGKRAEPPALT
ncbi:MAG: hypothetical protein EOS26_15365 [Mesorhizobium sp.]|nr:MAG: hypothetical protein EOS26_15365 [Mesorhizobium sp.]